MGASLSAYNNDDGGPPMDGPNGSVPLGAVDVPFRARSEGRRTSPQCGEVPLVEVPHAPHECPPALSRALSPAEFERLMSPLDAVAQRTGMTYLGARVVSARVGYGSVPLLLALIVASVADAYIGSGGVRHSRSSIASPIYIAAVVSAAALLLIAVVLTRRVNRRERAAAQAVRDALGQLVAPAMAARGVSVDVVAVLAHAGAARFIGGGVVCTYAVRFGLPPSLQLGPPAPMMMMVVAPGPGGYGGTMMVPVAAPLGYPVQGYPAPQQHFFPSSPSGVYAPSPQHQHQHQHQHQQQLQPVPMAQYATPQAPSGAGEAPPGMQARPQQQLQNPYRGASGGSSGGGSGGGSGGLPSSAKQAS
jgi:hypothetical protein